MGLVSTWLNGIGLGHAIPSFKAAGIVTPSALAELDLAHYEALGVKEPADRRKLFYLVQRIKLAVDPKEEGGDEWTNGEEEKMVSSALGDTIVLDDSDDDEVPTRPRRSSRLSGPIQGRFSSKSNIAQPERLLKENVLNNSPSKRVQPSRSAEISDRRSSTGIGVRKSSRTTRASSTRDNEEDDSGWEEDETTDDASKNSSTVRRTSQRLQNKRNTRSSLATASGRKSVPTASTTRRQSSGTVGCSISRRQSFDSQSKSSSNSRRRSLPAADSLESSSSSKRTSSMARTQTRRHESKLPNPSSKRTGKQLSTIPADSVAPMSPLVSIPKSRLDAAVAEEEEKKKKSAATRARRKSFGISRSRSASSLDGGSSRQSESDSESSSSSRRKSSGRQSTGRAGSATRRRSMGGRPGLVKSRSMQSVGSDSGDSSSTRRRRKSVSSEPVFVHGMPVDDSWGAQVSAMRQDSNADHELFSNGGSNSIGNSLDDMRIRVVIRKRPMSKSEASTAGEIDVIHPLDYDDYGKVLVYQPKTRVDLTKEVESVPFAFDNVFDEAANNVQIYERTVRNLIPGVFDGQWASLFAYGQTGSGKTFTMMGSNLTGMKAGNSMSDESNSGLYYLAALDVFELANSPEYRHLSVGVSLFEIYGGKLFDLLNCRKPVKCLEDHKGQVCFPGLSEHPVTDARQLMEVIEAGAENRSTGSTSKNADSSRSHAVLQLSLRKQVGRKTNVEHGRLSFIDLAGSERGADTSQASRSTRLEGAEINTSLLALKEVIRALATGDSMAHIPFRGSKLTQVLKQSFVGKNARSVMIACVAPNISNCEHTLNTLRYANRVKERDAETGHASVDAVCTHSKTSVTRLSALSDRPTSTGTSFVDSSEPESEGVSTNPAVSDCNEEAVERCVDDEDSVLLDDLLKPEPHSPTAVAAGIGETAQPTNKRQVAESLISTHRSVMTEMLGMVKSEMLLVNSTDTDRGNMQEYLQELEGLQEKQLSLISTLRESLLEYYASRGSSESVDDLDAILSDDSFDDLRD